MALMAESQTGKHAYYDQYGNRYLFVSHKEYNHYLVHKMMSWILSNHSYKISV